VLCGQAIAGFVGVSSTLGITIGTVGALVITLFGHDLVHRYARVVTLLVGAVFLAVTIKVLTVGNFHAVAHPVDTAGNVLLAISIVATFQLTWAPFVADYSRYLPEKTSSVRATFWYTYLGTSLAGLWVMVVGALVAVQSEAALSDTPGYLGHLFGGGVSWLVFLVFAMALTAANVLDLYSASMSTVTLLDPIFNLRRARTDRVVRWGVAIVGCAAGTLVAVQASAEFLTNFQNFLVFLLYLMVPWTAINLVDFYLVRRGRYSIPDIFNPRGQYGAVNWWALAIYVGTVAVEVPFMNNQIYVGPIAKALGGADIAWLVALVVAGGVYYVVAKARVSPYEPDIAVGVDAERALH
jgi:NCS1 family nucleobase:cation symporter-1